MGKSKKTSAKISAKAKPDVKPDAILPAKPQQPSKKSELNTFGKLHLLNKWMSIAYLVQLAAIIILASGEMFSVTASFLGVDSLASDSNKSTVYAPASQHLFDLSLAQVLALSLGISAAFHAIVANLLRPVYEAMLAEKENPYRWMENAFSFSLLPVAIGLVVGVRDIASMLMIFVLGFAAHILGWQFEHHLAGKREQDARRVFALMAVAALTAWLVVGGYALASVLFGNGLPAYAAAAFAAGLGGVLGTGWVLQQYKKASGKWGDYLRVEQASIILNYTVKSLVTWLLFIAVQ